MNVLFWSHMSGPAPQQDPENVLAPKRLRREEAGRTDHEEGMTTVTTTPDTTESLSLGQIWQRLSPLITEAWAQPISIDIHPDLITAYVQFQWNDRAAVDGAFNAFAVVNMSPQFYPDWALDDGKPTERRRYGVTTADLESPLFPGVRLALYCFVETQADPWVHGEAFGLPPRRECLCCGSRDCAMVRAVTR